jgi:hypothetical protein
MLEHRKKAILLSDERWGDYHISCITHKGESGNGGLRGELLFDRRRGEII